MTLGERIYKLRSERNMSQEALADALGVSRQSISKWETDGAVPELEKLVKLGAYFGVSMDALILGEEAGSRAQPEQTAQGERAEATVPVRDGPSRKTVGLILLCFGALAPSSRGCCSPRPFFSAAQYACSLRGTPGFGAPGRCSSP